MVLTLEAGEIYLIVSSLYIDNNLYFCVFAQFEFIKKRQFPRLDEHHQFQLIPWSGILFMQHLYCSSNYIQNDGSAERPAEN
jgi:hypothetical protein